MISQRFTKITSRARQKEYYSDFTMNFDLNPVTGNLQRLINHDAVKQSIKNIVMTQIGERPYTDFGSLVPHSLFDPMDSLFMGNISTSIELAIKNYEPRATNVTIKVYVDEAHNAYSVDISFAERQLPDVIQTVSIINRVR
jgi:phage baseplate assembly protein W